MVRMCLIFMLICGGDDGGEERMWASMATTSCASVEAVEECLDEEAALWLKLAAIAAILIAGAVGVAIPLVGGKGRLVRTDGGVFVCVKAFAAGVVLATGFVHMLHAAESSLTNPCLPDSPWRKFPFAGFVAMVAALGTLVVDFVGTQFYERKHREDATGASAAADLEEKGITAALLTPEADSAGRGKDPMHIVGMHAHAAAHRHSHSHAHGACDGPALPVRSHGHAHEEEGEGSSNARHVVVSQVTRSAIASIHTGNRIDRTREELT